MNNKKNSIISDFHPCDPKFDMSKLDSQITSLSEVNTMAENKETKRDMPVRISPENYEPIKRFSELTGISIITIINKSLEIGFPAFKKNLIKELNK